MKKLPPIKTMMNEAWEMVKLSAWPLVKLHVITLVIFIAIMVVVAIMASLGGLSGMIMGKSASNIQWPILGLSVIGGVASVWVLFAAMGIGTLLIVNKKGSLDAVAAMKASLPLIVPMVFAYLLVSFLVFGSMVLLFFPGLLVLILLSFAQLDVVLGKHEPFAALRRSAFMVQTNFGQLFVHLGSIFLVYIAVFMILPNILSNAAPQLKGLISILSSVGGIVWGWFMVAYMVLLYKKLSADVREKKIWWMWVMAVIGWVLFFLLMSTIMRVVTSPAFMDTFKKQRPGMQNEKMMQQYKQQMEQYDSSQDSDTYTQ